jgi:acetate kinase
MTETILVLNAGSSSIKFQLFAITARDKLQRRLKGQIEGIGLRPRLVAGGEGKKMVEETWPETEARTVPEALDKVIAFLRTQLDGALPAAIGHRVVHGGAKYGEPTQIDDAVLDDLQRLSPLAPLHQPNNLAPISAVRQRHPQLPQVACFDTAFHRTHPEVADRYAIPEALYEDGVRRYGFHGLSYEYIAGRLRDNAPQVSEGRVVAAHLGSGASMCAMASGVSVESTMGFTALDGLPMGTRPGQLDAGVVLYLMQEKQMTAPEIERLLYSECGLKGLSGFSNDVRDLLASSNKRAKLAIDYFVYRVALFSGMLAAAMGGMDAFVFTGGIGENAPAIRYAVARRLAWLGVKIDSPANLGGHTRISRHGARVGCYVIPTDEELMIARHTLQVLRDAPALPLKERCA